MRSWLLSQHPPVPGCGSGLWMTHAVGTCTLGIQHIKRAVVRCLYDRGAMCIAQQGQNLREEENHLLHGESFLHPSLQGSTTGKGRRIGHPLSTSLKWLMWVGRSEECVRTSTSERCSGIDSPSVFSSLRSRTPSLWRNKKANVYPCTCGGVYIGETRRDLLEWRDQHTNFRKGMYCELFSCHRQKRTWSNSRVCGGLFLANQKYVCYP